jgi:broad specificity phosphatase PhoE
MGHSNVELSADGRRQSGQLRDYIAEEKISAVYASDLLRTMTTAQILTAGHQVPVVPCPELREMHYGVCEGLTFGEIGRDYPDVARACANFTPELEFPEGETFLKFADRVIGFLERLKSYTQPGSILVVTHNGPIKVLICHLLGISMVHWWQVRTDTASLSIVDTTIRGAVLTRLNDTSYLKKAG